MSETNEKQLHVFANEVTDWVVAYDSADAVKAWEESCGQKYDTEDDGGEFEQEPDEEFLNVYEEETTDRETIPVGAVLIEKGDYSHTYRATMRAWADARGRCFLCSTEY